MKSQYAKTNCRLLFCADVDKAHNAAMRFAVHNSQLTEILVERYKDTRLCIRSRKDLIVTWIFGPVA